MYNIKTATLKDRQRNAKIQSTDIVKIMFLSESKLTETNITSPNLT